MTDAIIIRPFRETDRDFIEGSWMLSFRDGLIDYLQTPYVRRSVYYRGQRKLIHALMNRPGAVCLIAATADYDDAILGWMLLEGEYVVHYVYVKDAFRGQGIARQLLASVNISEDDLVYTHVTKKVKDLLERRTNATFNPWLLCEAR